VLRRPLEPGQYLSIRYTERLAEAGAVASVGSRGDSYDNALAETIIGLYKTELIRRRGPWKGIDEVEYATPGVGRLVQPPPAPGADRLPPASRARSHLLEKGDPRQH
jgi:transposase InsO family protein